MSGIQTKGLYTDSQKKAIYKYVENNREKINQYNNDYYHMRMEDPDFREHRREQIRKYKQKNKNDPDYIAKRREHCRRYYEKKKLARELAKKELQ
jgi:hypothetical protein